MAQHGSGIGSIIATVAGRYALALFKLAQETKSIDKVEGELNQFNGFVEESADLKRLIRSPVFTAEQKERAVTAILAKAGMKGYAANFICLMARQERLSSLSDAIRIYHKLSMADKGIVNAEVMVAEEPSAKTLASIKKALQETTGAEVDIDLKIDPNLIGGLVVKMGSRMVDGSVRTKLNSIRLAMKEVR